MLSAFIQEHTPLLLQTLRELCVIPAPSGAEQARAAYCRRWLRRHAGLDADIDEVNNVLLPLGCGASNSITVVAAHTDIVFDDAVSLSLYEDERILRCPGVGDNSASCAVLLLAAKYLAEQSRPPSDLLLVWNSCEEGLGNLKGIRAVCERTKGRMARFLSLDCHLHEIATQSVGSYRYRVTVRTEGGHSYLAFGKANAIAILSQIVQNIYSLPVPSDPLSRTTYNVGTMEGGTSVNTIAQEATMLCEIRSDNADHLRSMRTAFAAVFEQARQNGADITVTCIGERPCMGEVNADDLNAFIELCKHTTAAITGRTPVAISSSTDCNMPLSMGIPSVCIGVYDGDGMHTREEWVDKASLPKGLEIAIRVLEQL